MIPLISALATVAPGLAASLAERALFVPRGPRRSARGDLFLKTGARADVRVGDGLVATWSWGDGPTVVCLHGWAGAAVQFRSIVPALVDAGQRVVAFDAPGHGRSPGRRSSILAMRDALLRVVEEQAEPVAVIAHSGGAAAATLAMAAGLEVTRAAFIGPTIDPAALVEEWALNAGLSAAVLDGVKARTSRRYGAPWSALRILPHAKSRREPLLVVHDWNDAEVPWTEGADLVDAWPRARFLLTRGLGHRRVLHDPVVAETVAHFIAAS